MLPILDCFMGKYACYRDLTCLNIEGLDEYVSGCKSAGFRSWDSLDRITENDLAALNMRLGDRRKLQREIARRHQWPDTKPLPVQPFRSHQPRSDITQSSITSPLKPPSSSSFSSSSSSRKRGMTEPPNMATHQGHQALGLSLQELEKGKVPSVSGGEALRTVKATHTPAARKRI